MNTWFSAILNEKLEYSYTTIMSSVYNLKTYLILVISIEVLEYHMEFQTRCFTPSILENCSQRTLSLEMTMKESKESYVKCPM